MVLEDENVQVVEIFVTWLYTRRFYFNSAEERVLGLRIYVFADNICMERFCNEIIDSYTIFCLKDNKVPNHAQVLWLSLNGFNKSQLAKFAMKMNVHDMLASPTRFTEGYGKADLKDWANHPELIQDFMDEVFLYQKKPYENPSNGKDVISMITKMEAHTRLLLTSDGARGSVIRPEQEIRKRSKPHRQSRRGTGGTKQ